MIQPMTDKQLSKFLLKHYAPTKFQEIGERNAHIKTDTVIAEHLHALGYTETAKILRELQKNWQY